MPTDFQPATPSLLPATVERRIYSVRGLHVMLDAELAVLYGVEVRTLNQAVTRNKNHFPADFAFRLTSEEWNSLRSQTVILDAGRGRHTKYPPRVFTEHGVLMLSSVLRSKRAIKVNITIMRTFIRLRELLASHTDLSRKLEELERRYDSQFSVIFKALRELIDPPVVPAKPRIGFEEP